MSYRNSFDHLVFLDSEGIGLARREAILDDFDTQRRFFLMDYADPRDHFTGHITAILLDDSGLDLLKGAFAAFGPTPYPPDFPRNLGFARAVGDADVKRTTVSVSEPVATKKEQR